MFPLLLGMWLLAEPSSRENHCAALLLVLLDDVFFFFLSCAYIFGFGAWLDLHKLQQPSFSRQRKGYVEQEAGCSVFLHSLH